MNPSLAPKNSANLGHRRNDLEIPPTTDSRRPTTMFVDSHAHLEGRRYDADRAEVMARARAAGIEAMVAIGNGEGPNDVDCGIKVVERYSPQNDGSQPPRESQVSAKSGREPGAPSGNTGFEVSKFQGFEVSESQGFKVAGGPGSKDSQDQGRGASDPSRYPAIYATIGIHPHEAALADRAAYERMAELAKHPRVIAWGEIGLDYYYDHSPREVQQRVFREQMELARAARLPIVIHCRPSDNSENAWDDCLRMIHDEWAPSGLGGVLHCFTGNTAQAKRALDMGFMISFAGNVTFPKAQGIREAALTVPLERMLIETDSPYLAPIPHRGKRNEPAYVIEVARQLGELRGLAAEEIGERTTQNFYRFFSLHEKVPTV